MSDSRPGCGSCWAGRSSDGANCVVGSWAECWSWFPGLLPGSFGWVVPGVYPAADPVDRNPAGTWADAGTAGRSAESWVP